MKILYLDLGMGAAGDMLSAALYELLDDSEKENFLKEINHMGLSGVCFKPEEAFKCGIKGTHMGVLIEGEQEESLDEGHGHFHDHEHVDEGHAHAHSAEDHVHCGHEEHSKEGHDHEEHVHSHEHFAHHHAHASMTEVLSIIDGLNISDKAKTDAKGVYALIAQAESRAHGTEVSEVHFHEVGTLDAIGDITAVCLLMERLAFDRVIASPVCTGFGYVNTSHGLLPVPAPATADILRGIPSYAGNVKGELCTPTGAALVKYFASGFGRMPLMETEKIGYGMGTKDFKKCNCVRAMAGESTDLEEGLSFKEALWGGAGENRAFAAEGENDQVREFIFTVDDMTGEEIGFASEELLKAGALDVCTRPVYMKKNRPGTQFLILLKEEDRERMVSEVFRHTSTIGIREAVCERYILKREDQVLETPLGPIRKKFSEGYGVRKEKWEYEDLASIAKEKGISLKEVKNITGSQV